MDVSRGFDVRGRALHDGELAAWLSEHSLGNRFALDVVGTHAGYGAKAVALAIVAADGEGRYLDPAALAPDDEEALASWLADPGPPKALHDAKAAMHALAGQGWTLRGVTTDTVLAGHLLRPGQHKLSLNDLLVHHMRCALPADSTEVSVQALILRTCAVLDLADVLDEELARIDSSSVLSRVELPVQRVLAQMETAGIAVDRARLAGDLNPVAADGRIHTTFDQTGADTGRIRSVNPAIPEHGARDAFVAGDGYAELMTAGYRDIERCVQAHLSGDVVAEARRLGYAGTVSGRRHYVAESDALTAAIQGSVADVIKVAMINVSQAIEDAQLTSRLLLQVHDELVFEVAHGEREELVALVREHLADDHALHVPLDISIGFGRSWATATDTAAG